MIRPKEQSHHFLTKSSVGGGTVQPGRHDSTCRGKLKPKYLVHGGRPSCAFDIISDITCWKCCCLNIRVLSIWGVMVQVCSSCLDAPSTWCLTPQIAKHLIFNSQLLCLFDKRLLALPIQQGLDHFQSLPISLSFVLWLRHSCCGFDIRVVASTFMLWLQHLCCGLVGVYK